MQKVSKNEANNNRLGPQSLAKRAPNRAANRRKINAKNEANKESISDKNRTLQKGKFVENTQWKINKSKQLTSTHFDNLLAPKRTQNGTLKRLKSDSKKEATKISTLWADSDDNERICPLQASRILLTV